MTNTIKKILGFALLFSQIPAHAIVDMKNSNFSDNWTDLIVPGIGYDLRVNRTYNSRSLFSGLFGFGWCSDYETRIEVTPEGSLRLYECGGGMEVVYSPRNFNSKKIDGTIQTILDEVKKRRPELTAEYLADLKEQLKTNDFLREEFGRKLELKGKVEDGTLFLANGRETESITLKQGVYKRTMADGTYQMFTANTGRMTHMYDKNQNYLKIVWNKDLIVSVTDNMQRKLTFKYNETSRKISQITGPEGLVAKYTIAGEDLVGVVDAKKKTFKYAYDDVHNLTRIDFPDNTFKALTYNKDKDWVLSFRNQKGCVETYDYQLNPKDPSNHFWSNVQKKCGSKVTNKSKYEFFHRNKPDGSGIYLYRVKSDVNGSVTDIVYHEQFGKPISIARGTQRTEYTYYENGFVKSKKEAGKISAYEYDDACFKVSKVTIKLFDTTEKSQARKSSQDQRKPSQAKSEKVFKTLQTNYRYEPKKCNLLSANTSDGQVVKLKFDPQGRIEQIEDQSKKIVTIKYEGKFGKPSIVSRPGLGTIQVHYKPDGEIAKVESKEGPTVAMQVASIFNSLLDIIAPATNETPL